jgi:hypothetical protein
MSGVLHSSATVPLLGAIALVRVLWSSVLATIVVTVAFSAAIRFIVRSSEMRVMGRRGASLVYGGLAGLALSSFGAAVIYGLLLMARKS